MGRQLDGGDQTTLWTEVVLENKYHMYPISIFLLGRCLHSQLSKCNIFIDPSCSLIGYVHIKLSGAASRTSRIIWCTVISYFITSLVMTNSWESANTRWVSRSTFLILEKDNILSQTLETIFKNQPNY